MRSYALLVAAMLAGALAEPIPQNKEDEEKQSTGKSKSLEQTPASTQLVPVTVWKEALTTTFTPPPSCTENRLTMLEAQEFRIWLHEPMPLENTLIEDCYPSEFIQGYTSIPGSSSSIAPLLSPLVCPKGWNTILTQEDYIACCASGYQFTPPKSVDSKRPAYGGTCYSPFTLGQTTTVTLYGLEEISATREWVASRTGDQAFGHVIDGFALDLIKSTPATSSSSETGSVTGAPVDNGSDGSTNSSSSSISGGAIAGIVIGSLAGVAMIIGAAFFFVRRRAQQQGLEQIGQSRDQPSQQGNNINYDSKPLPHVYEMKDHVAENHGTSFGATGWTGADGRSEVTDATSPHATLASPVSELGGMQRHELASTDFAELDASQPRHEMRG